MHKLHCGKCGCNFISQQPTRFASCPRCGAHGDRDAAIFVWKPKYGPCPN